MRVTAFLLLSFLAASACKTTRNSHARAMSLNTLDNEEQLPACDDITVGRVYWVRCLNQEMHCEEGGTWQPRTVDPGMQDQPAPGPRGVEQP